MGYQPWRQAMQQALYGEGGFYRATSVPSRHFRTAAHVGGPWIAAWHRLVTAVDEALGQPAALDVVEVGAGGGELLAGLAEVADPRWRLAGVDVAPRPPALPERVSWGEALPAPVTGVLLAVEWLDVVPLDVVELTEDGPRLVEVDEAGDEQLGPPPGAEDLDWLSRWWPLAETGDRAEVGLPRDEAWALASGRVERGLAVAVDYTAVPARDVAGTLTGYRDGRQCAPVPDGSCDLTAHVLFESLGDGTRLGQREVLRALGVDGRLPSYDDDPAAYGRALQAASDAAELLDRHGLGAFTWLVKPAGVDLPPPLGSLS